MLNSSALSYTALGMHAMRATLYSVRGSSPTPPSAKSFLLLEAGDKLLLESGDKFLLQNASSELAYNNIPLLVPASFVGSTAYTVGQVVESSGNWYVCTQSGTASSTAPSNTNGSNVTNGTCKFQYIGAELAASNDPDAPSVSYTTSTPSGLDTFYDFLTNQDKFTTEGAVSVEHLGTETYANLITIDNGNDDVGYGVAYKFSTDASKIGIKTAASTAGFRVLVNNRRLTSGMIGAAGGSDQWTVIDFGSSANRIITIETSYGFSGSQAGFMGVSVASYDTVEATAVEKKLAAIGDSIWHGSQHGPQRPGGQVPKLVGNIVGARDVYNGSMSSTGYVNGGDYSSPYSDKVSQLASVNPDAWMFYGSTNDAGNAEATIKAAAIAAWSAARLATPSAPIVIFGVWPIPNSGSYSQVVQLEQYYSEAFTTWNDANSHFVPICQDPDGPWLVGSWNDGGGTYTQNEALYLSDDNVHPSEAGIEYMAQKIATYLQNFGVI